MTEKEIIEQIVNTISKLEKPQKILLFGSRATGKAKPNSDYDIMVVKNYRTTPHRRSARLLAALSYLPINTDVVCYTPREIAERRSASLSFVSNALREAKLIYEK